jgi:hypothetical protein
MQTCPMIVGVGLGYWCAVVALQWASSVALRLWLLAVVTCDYQEFASVD